MCKWAGVRARDSKRKKLLREAQHEEMSFAFRLISVMRTGKCNLNETKVARRNIWCWAHNLRQSQGFYHSFSILHLNCPKHSVQKVITQTSSYHNLWSMWIGTSWAPEHASILSKQKAFPLKKERTIWLIRHVWTTLRFCFSKIRSVLINH